MSNHQNLIQTFRAFLNKAYVQLVTLGASEEQADQLLEEVDSYEYYCQNTTLESEADPIVFAKALARLHGIGIYDYAA